MRYQLISMLSKIFDSIPFFICAAMGYNEGQYSLPRWMDLSISRQGFFDDTFQKTPTEGWMFLPLDVYHGGGDAAKFEPLSKNIKVSN